MKNDPSWQNLPFGRTFASVPGAVKRENAEHYMVLLLVGFAVLCWLLGSSARVYAVKEDYHAVLPS